MMEIPQGLQLTLIDIIREPCPTIPGLRVAARTGQKIVDMIDKININDKHLKRLSSTIQEVICSIYELSLEIVEKGTNVPSPLTEHINGLIITLEKIESVGQKVHSQVWMLKKFRIAIENVTYQLIQAEEVMRTEVVGQSVKVNKKKDVPLAPNSTNTTQAKARAHATGRNTVSGSNASRDNTFSPSFSTRNITAIGSGVHIKNEGNHYESRIINSHHPFTSSIPRTVPGRGQNRVEVCHDGQGTVVRINGVRMTPAGPIASSTTVEDAKTYEEGMWAVKSALDKIWAVKRGLSLVDSGGKYVVTRGELSVSQDGETSVIRDGRNIQSFSGLPILRIGETPKLYLD